MKETTVGFGIGLGPRIFRVRVSTRGVGLSSGAGPFSIYAHSGGGRRRRASTRSAGTGPTAPVYLPGDTTTTNLIGAGAHELVPTGSDEIVAQLNRAQSWITVWFCTGFALIIAALFASANEAIFGILLVLGIAALVVAWVGFARRRVSLNYEVDSALTTWFTALAEGWTQLVRTNGRWRMQSSTYLHRTHHQKVNAGASNLVSRHRVVFRLTPPMALKANVKVPTVKAQRHSLVFLPDRLLVKSGRRWTDVDYNHLNVDVSQGPFIERSKLSVPRDGTKIGERWQYTNVKGGPDRRFKNNRLLPVMLYSEVVLTSPQGLRWELQLSRHEPATWWQHVLLARPRTPLLTTPLPEPPATTPTPDSSSEPVTSTYSPQTSAGETPGPVDQARTPAPSPTTPPVQPATPGFMGTHVPAPPRGEPIQPWGRPSNQLEVAGEKFHQGDIKALLNDDLAVRSAVSVEHQESAVLVPDPENPHGDGHAIAVFIRGKHVGYVPHGQSGDYFPHVAAMTSGGRAVTVAARVWLRSDHYSAGFNARVSLYLPGATDFAYPETMPQTASTVLLPIGSALQATGEEKHLDALMPFLGKNVAVTLHNVTVEKGRERIDLVEVRLDGDAVGRFTAATSRKIGPLVAHVERLGRLPVARASVSGSSQKADVTVYVARAGDVPPDWLDTPPR